MILVCNNTDGVDEVLQALQWDMPVASRSRLARMHAERLTDSMLKLREQKDYMQAVDEIDSIKNRNKEFLF